MKAFGQKESQSTGTQASKALRVPEDVVGLVRGDSANLLASCVSHAAKPSHACHTIPLNLLRGPRLPRLQLGLLPLRHVGSL